MPITIRKLSPKDSPLILALSQQLGYQPTPEALTASIQKADQYPDHFAAGALVDDVVIGWIHAFQTFRIESEPFVEIAGLVVDKNHRKKGAARALINAVKAWARSTGHTRLRVRTNVVRQDTHRFYEHLGFKEKKRQKVYQWVLD